MRKRTPIERLTILQRRAFFLPPGKKRNPWTHKMLKALLAKHGMIW